MPTTLNKALAVSVIAAMIVAVAGCGGDSKSKHAALPKQNPALVASDKPGSVVRQYWRYVQLGAVPPALELYDQRVRRQAGVVVMSGALADQQFALKGSTAPVILSQERTPT